MNNFDAMIFNGETPMMSGTWYNPSTGDSFTVADNFFQDNQYLVKTTDGRMLDYNIRQNYIKSDTPIPKASENPTKDPWLAVKESLPKEVSNILDMGPDNSNSGMDILPDDLDLIRPKTLGNLNDPVKSQPVTHVSNPFDVIIERALAKKEQPLLSTVVNWEDFPKKEIELLINVLDIDVNDIIKWYISQIDLSKIENIIANELAETIKYNLSALNDKKSSTDSKLNDTLLEPTTAPKTEKIKSNKEVVPVKNVNKKRTKKS